MPPPPEANDDLGPLPPPPPLSWRRRAGGGLGPHMVDVVSRVLYLLAFVVAAIVFGVLYS